MHTCFNGDVLSLEMGGNNTVQAAGERLRTSQRNMLDDHKAKSFERSRDARL